MLTSDLFNKPVEENCKYGRYYCTTDKKYKCRQGPTQTRASESVEQGVAEETNPIDTVEMDVPLLIRALEYAREDAKDDVDLHKVVERLIAAAQAGEALNMDDYNMIFGDSESEHEQDMSEELAYEPDEKGLQHDKLTMPANTLVIDTPGDLDWYKLGHDIANLDQADPHEYGQSDSDVVITTASPEEMQKLMKQLDRLGMRYKAIGGTNDQPEIHDEKYESVSEGKFDPINDDDFYEYNVNTNEIVARTSIKDPTVRKFTPNPAREWPGRDSNHKIVKGFKAKYLKPKSQDVVDEAKKKKKKKSKSSLMSKPAKRKYGGYYYPGYGYYGDSGDSGGGDGGGGESRINEKKDKTKLSTLDLRSELDAHATTLLNIARKKYPMAKSDLAALIKLLDRVQLHSIEKDTAHDKDIKAIRRDVAALEKRVNELYKKQKVKESRLYYSVAGTLNESLRKDFKMRKDRKGWFLPESASTKQKLDAERAFGEPIAEMNLLRPIKMKGPKNPVAVNQNGNKYKNPAKLIKFGK